MYETNEAANPPYEHVVVIDDKWEEAKPLIAHFERHGVPALYIKGFDDVATTAFAEADAGADSNGGTYVSSEAETEVGVAEGSETGTGQDGETNMGAGAGVGKVPDATGVIFLDLQLIDGVSDDKSIASSAYGALESAIGQGRFPYVLFIWSRHADAALDTFVSILEDSSVMKPFRLIDMDKASFFRRDNDAYRFIEGGEAKLRDKIDGAFADMGALLALWEFNRLARQAVSRFTARIAPQIDWRDDRVNEKALATLALAANREPHALDEDRVVEGAFTTLSRALQGQFRHEMLREKPSVVVSASSLRNASIKKDYVFASIDKDGNKCYSNNRGSAFHDENELSDELKVLALKRIATLNTCMFMLEAIPHKGGILVPGSLCDFNDKLEGESLDSFNSDVFRSKRPLESEVRRLWLELTPLCDYALGKCDEYLFVEAVFVHEGSVGMRKVNSGGYLYSSPLFYLDNQIGRFYINFRHKRVIPHDDQEIKAFQPVALLTESILSDIRFDFVSHIGRIGIPS